MTALERKRKIKKSRVGIWINLPICIASFIIGIDAINNFILWKIIFSAIIFLISLNMSIILFQHIGRIQEAD